jgi:SWI/SNF-related matrix-associated actin-dependent regulator of chromatin subfamily E protein 1
MWREAADSEKSVYQEEYDQEKIEYDKALKAYHNSAAYQAFLASKKAKGPDKPPMTATASISGGGNRPPMRVVSAGVEIQPVDEDENTGDAYFSQRLLADVRFKRNHRLIADLFSTNIVADTRSVVSQPRIDSLKRQAHSLTEHQVCI